MSSVHSSVPSVTTDDMTLSATEAGAIHKSYKLLGHAPRWEHVPPIFSAVKWLYVSYNATYGIACLVMSLTSPPYLPLSVFLEMCSLFRP